MTTENTDNPLVDLLANPHENRGSQWYDDVLAAISSVTCRVAPGRHNARERVKADIAARRIPRDADLLAAADTTADAAARADGTAREPLPVQRPAPPPPAVVAPDEPEIDPADMPLEIIWVGDEFTVAEEGTNAAHAADTDAWSSIATVADLKELVGAPDDVWRFINEDDLEGAGVDSDAFETDVSVLPDDMPVDGDRVWSILMDQELLPAPHQGQVAGYVLYRLPAAVIALADVGGASPMNSEGFVTFAAANHGTVVELLRDAGHLVVDAGKMWR